MARTVPTTGTDRQRLATVAANLFVATEIHTTSDEKRVWMGGTTLVSGAVWLGTVANQTAMLALNSSASTGCFPMDECYRSDTGTIWKCISNRGALLADWIEIKVPLDTDATLSANSDTKIASQKAVKTYVDNMSAGLAWKTPVRAATTANITLSGTQTIDGVACVAGDRVLVKNQTTGSQNGIYLCASSTWTRATDADAGTELVSATVMVREGTTLADTQWTCTNDSVTVGTTSIAFVQIGIGGTTYTADNSTLQLVSGVFSVKNAVLLALAGLSNASGVLTNNGSGTLSWGAGGSGGGVGDSLYLFSIFH